VLTDAAATEQALGTLERSVELALRAVALDPVSVDTRFFLGLSYLFLGRLTEAEAETRRMIELSSNGIFSHSLLSSVLLLQGRNEEALAEAQKEPEKMYRLQSVAASQHALGRTRESDAALQTLIAECGDTAPFPIAWVYTLRNDRDQAFAWLDRAWELRDAGISWVRGDTLLRNLHPDPRWPVFLKKIGLADEQLK
jgi:tetratricopeptide (TPR) repeat protein